MMENGRFGDPEVPGSPNEPEPANAGTGDPEVPGDGDDTIAFGEPPKAGDPEVPGNPE